MDKSNSLDWLSGGGEMGALIRAHDWSTTKVGPAATWPQSLKTAVSICLGSKFPMFVWWGQDLTVFYNDGFTPCVGPVKHPKYLGRSASEQWAEVWDVLGPLTDQVLRTGEPTWHEDMPLFMIRTGFVEETYYTFSYSPAREESGDVGGVFCACQETTAQVLSARRMRLLKDLGSEIDISTINDVINHSLGVLKAGEKDLPFTMLYLLDPSGKSASLAGTTGILPGTIASPDEINLLNEHSQTAWPISEVIKSKTALHLQELSKLFPGQLPETPWDEAPGSAYLLPIEAAGSDQLAGVLILGISPRRPFDSDYKNFTELVAGHIATNITNARAVEVERKRAEALAEIDRTKTAFFSNVSHEFRTPLTLMLGPIEDMLSAQEGALSPELRQNAEVIHRNALRLLKLVNALLDFSRIESGRAQAVYEPSDLSTVTTDLASSFRSAIERGGMKLTVDCPPLSEPAYVDREMWEKIVLNLLSNAFKFTLKGEIKISLQSIGDAVEMSVSDTGTGIPEQELPKIFNRFHRVAGAEGRTYEGTGIGLALVQELVKLHGGTVQVKSVFGKGTTFTVTIPKGFAHLPKERVQQTKKDSGEVEHRADSFIKEAIGWLPDDMLRDSSEKDNLSDSIISADPMSRKYIVLVDDNTDMRRYVRNLLEAHYEVSAFPDGKRALEGIRSRRPDLIVSDIMMPVMDGIELLQTIRKDPALQTLPVILLSARAGEEAKTSGIELGADDYLTKPFSAKELLVRVKTQLTLNEVRKKSTEQESLVSHLQTQQIWLEAILDRLPSPVLLLELESGIVKFANRAAHTMAGGKFPDLTARAASGEKIKDAEAVWNTPMGQFFLLADSELVSLPGEPARVILCYKDVTHMKEVQLELKRLISARDEFLSIASHELNTPLTSLRLQTQIHKRLISMNDSTAFTPQRVQETVEQTEKQVMRIGRLVDDMLDVSRIRTGNLPVKKEHFNFNELIHEVITRLNNQFSGAGYDLPVFKDCENAEGNWDKMRVEQILNNLLTNAIRYGDKKPIQITLKSTNNQIQLSVKDHGIGIAGDAHEKIFDRFERAISANEVSGMGLGLFITKQIVLSHGGRIWVESAPGKGSEFFVELPKDSAKPISSIH